MRKKTVILLCIICFLVSVCFSVKKAEDRSEASAALSARKLGQLCINQMYPGVEWKQTTGQKKQEKEEKTVASMEVDNSKPLVIIYHTHSSESYMPYSESNFHREEETGTVREVGDVLLAELNALGIPAVHDKTVHDRPSYNQSYDRSLETATALLRNYPTAVCVIDLHRDAAAYTGNVGETLTIEGDTAAKYKLVVGQNNDNYSQLMAFAQEINGAAEKLYPGFSGRIIEKTYRYNQYISDKYLLLEVGNNQNDIEDARACGKYFAHVLAEVLKEENQ